MEHTQTCKTCGHTKPVSAFSFAPQWKRPDSTCKACRNIAHNAARKKAKLVKAQLEAKAQGVEPVVACINNFKRIRAREIAAETGLDVYEVHRLARIAEKAGLIQWSYKSKSATRMHTYSSLDCTPSEPRAPRHREFRVPKLHPLQAALYG